MTRGARNDETARMRWGRRAITIPGYAIAAILAVATLPFSFPLVLLHDAVRRNRWKRLIREAFRHAREQLPAGVDLVVIPRPTAEPELRAITDSLVALAARAAARLDR